MSVAALVFACLDTGIPGYQTNFPLTGVLITPPVASLSPGDHVQFQAKGVTQQSDSVPVAVIWSARYGTITADGLYTAPTSGQEDIVTARVKGTSFADSAVVSLKASPIGQVKLVPSSATIFTGNAVQLRLVVLNTAGDTINANVVWTSSAPTVASVNGSGLVMGVDTGSATITAAAGGKQGTSVISVSQPPPSGTWPHEPSSYTLIADEPWSVLSPLKWVLEFGTAAIAVDATAPESPPLVLQFTYPAGMVGGVAPGTMDFPLSGQHQLFVGMWWKPSSPWQGHVTGSNKIQYAFTDANGSITMVMYGPIGGPFEIRVYPQFSTSAGVWLTPNVATVPVQLGVWHRLEWQLIYSTDANTPNGIVRWWLDGTLVGDYENQIFPSAGLSAYKIAPVWGGVADVKQETDYYWIDQVHISGQ